MYCPYCQHEDTRVIDSRVSEDGSSIRRRRECGQCNERFSTLETPELKLPVVIKGDGSRVAFDVDKLRLSMQRALHKRPVDEDVLEAAVRRIVWQARTSGERELASRRIGDFVMAQMRGLDHIGYVRFASVYRRFEDVSEFREEIEMLERDLPSSQGQLRLLGVVEDERPPPRDPRR
ncbi:MAG TPA: transcriptional regulator NrdR [Chiayiivirga sp.]|nr:transcriptional regulator NrdR [Chiayiivirga sp.]